MSDKYFGKYSLSEESIMKLNKYETLLKECKLDNDNLWHQLFKIENPKPETNNEPTDPIPMDVEENMPNTTIEPMNDDHSFMPSSQFFFTQVSKPKFVAPAAATVITATAAVVTDKLELDDIANSIYESLETNKTLDTECLKNLSDEKVADIFENLSQKLDVKEIFNLCSSICEIELDVGIQYVKIICSKILLPKIIELKESSRQIITLLPKMINKFPEDIETLIYIPMINIELQENSTILSIIGSFNGQLKTKLISDFLIHVKELKPWHITILPVLIDVKVDANQKNRLLTILAEKATIFSKDKNYSKFVLSFMKLNTPFSEEQKNNLDEIAAVNQTIFKKAIQNILNNMYVHRDLWHIT